MTIEAEALDLRGAELGRKLVELEEEIRTFHHVINFGPDIEGEADVTLAQVKKLIEVAADLYPYYDENI